MSTMDSDLALAILKHCFPEADSMRIVHKSLDDGDRHILTDVNRFIVEYEQDRKTQRKHLIMKVPHTSGIFSSGDKLDVYDQEINVYKTVIPEINKYLDRSLAPAYLYATDSKILVLEDLVVRGYKSGEKHPLLNLSQAKSVMKAYAHFHAASRKVFENDASVFKNFLSPWLEVVDAGKRIHIWEKVVLELLNKKSKTHFISKVEAFIPFLKKDNDGIRKLLDQSKFKFTVLNHGDCRKDNVLFKSTPTDELKVQIIDYQLCFWCTPACDIIYFLVTSVAMDVIGAHLDDVVDTYLDELNITLKKLKCGITYGRVDFDQDFKNLKFFLFAIFFLSCAFHSPLSREQLKYSFNKSGPDLSYLCDLCLKDENFVNFVYGWINYFEKSKIFDEF